MRAFVISTLEFTSVPSRSKIINLIFIGNYITRPGDIVSIRQTLLFNRIPYMVKKETILTADHDRERKPVR